MKNMTAFEVRLKYTRGAPIDIIKLALSMPSVPIQALCGVLVVHQIPTIKHHKPPDLRLPVVAGILQKQEVLVINISVVYLHPPRDAIKHEFDLAKVSPRVIRHLVHLLRVNVALNKLMGS